MHRHLGLFVPCDLRLIYKQNNKYAYKKLGLLKKKFTLGRNTLLKNVYYFLKKIALEYANLGFSSSESDLLERVQLG